MSGSTACSPVSTRATGSWWPSPTGASSSSLPQKLLFHTLIIETNGGASFTFTNTQGKLRDLFQWAMNEPIPAAE